MSELSVRLERLAPMRIASTSAIAHDAEHQSWLKLKAWAGPRGLLEVPGIRLFGFDNCQPDPNHQYTMWMSIGDSVQAEGDVTIFDFPGGLFAVTSVQGPQNIHNAWEGLVAWQKANGYHQGNNPGLEEPFGDLDAGGENLTFNLYLPLAE